MNDCGRQFTAHQHPLVPILILIQWQQLSPGHEARLVQVGDSQLWLHCTIPGELLKHPNNWIHPKPVYQNLCGLSSFNSDIKKEKKKLLR